MVLFLCHSYHITPNNNIFKKRRDLYSERGAETTAQRRNVEVQVSFVQIVLVTGIKKKKQTVQ